MTSRQRAEFTRGVAAVKRAWGGKAMGDPDRAFAIASAAKGSNDDYQAGVRTAYNLLKRDGNREAANRNLVKYGFKPEGLGAAKPKIAKFVLKIGNAEAHQLQLSPRDAAVAAAQIAKGTFDRNKSWHEQPDNARPGRAVKLLDETGAVVMDCRPSLRPTGQKPFARHTFALCDIAPSFKKKIQKRRRHARRR